MAAIEKKCVMEVDEIIINLVKERPHLYQTTRGDYRDTFKRDNAFKEIGAKVDLSGEEVHKRWQCLRERYTREKRKLKNKTGIFPEKRPKWQFYTVMNFLDEFIIPRKRLFRMTENSPLPSECVEIEHDDSVTFPTTSCEDIIIEEGLGASYEQSCSTPSTTSSCQDDVKPKRRRITDSNNSEEIAKTFAAVGSLLCQSLANVQQEEDVFCDSVAHCLKRFSPQQKALAKFKIQQILYETEFCS